MLAVSRKWLSPSLYRQKQLLNVAYRLQSSAADRFKQAVDKLNTLGSEPSNDDKLKLYGLFKQATVGPCSAPKPSAFDFVGKAKWEAWKNFGNMSQDDAKSEYSSLVDKLAGSSAPAQQQSSSPGTSAGKYEGLLVSLENGIFRIQFNRPEKKNSLTQDMYKSITKLLKEANENDEVRIAVMTGTSDYFSSGNDLGNFMKKLDKDIVKMAKDASEDLRDYIGAYIDFKKPLIALVNGPSIGVSFTILGLFDIIYASEKAYFTSPFSKLGISPEGCSSYTFPRIMGLSKASEILLLNKVMTAKEAKDCGFIADYFPDDKFKEETKKILQTLASQPPKSLMYSKILMRDQIRQELHKVNQEECDRLAERFVSPECIDAILKFFQSKGKL